MAGRNKLGLGRGGWVGRWQLGGISNTKDFSEKPHENLLLQKLPKVISTHTKKY